MAQDHPPPRQPLGPRGADEIGVQHVDHRGPHHPGIPARAEQAQRQRGQHQMREGPVTPDRKPAEFDREDIKQQQAYHELRGRYGDETADHQHLIQRSAAIEGRCDTQCQTDQQFAEDGCDHQQQRRRQPRPDQLCHLGPLQIAPPQIALHQSAEIAPILDDERLIEAEVLPDAGYRLGCGRPSGNLAHRIGGQDVKQKECDETDADQYKHRTDQAPGKVGGHQSAPLCVGSSTSRSASPTRLNASASSSTAAPGMNTNHGADWK